MPTYTPVTIPYSPNPHGTSDVFSKQGTFAASTIGKSGKAPNRGRQEHFESQLRRLSEHLGTRRLPVFVDWEGGRRMDKGCIGHSVARGFLRSVEDSPRGYVEHVELS